MPAPEFQLPHVIGQKPHVGVGDGVEHQSDQDGETGERAGQPVHLGVEEQHKQIPGEILDVVGHVAGGEPGLGVPGHVLLETVFGSRRTGRIRHSAPSCHERLRRPSSQQRGSPLPGPLSGPIWRRARRLCSKLNGHHPLAWPQGQARRTIQTRGRALCLGRAPP